MSTEDSKKTVIVDLDNTLADYAGGWQAHSDFPGEPLDESVRELQRLKDAGWDVGILTTRRTELVHEWIEKYNLHHLIDFVNDNPNQPKDAGKHKPIGFAYIDDRGIRFSGSMKQIVDKLLAGKYQPWKRIPAWQKNICRLVICVFGAIIGLAGYFFLNNLENLTRWQSVLIFLAASFFIFCLAQVFGRWLKLD